MRGRQETKYPEVSLKIRNYSPEVYRCAYRRLYSSVEQVRHLRSRHGRVTFAKAPDDTKFDSLARFVRSRPGSRVISFFRATITSPDDWSAKLMKRADAPKQLAWLDKIHNDTDLWLDLPAETNSSDRFHYPPRNPLVTRVSVMGRDLAACAIHRACRPLFKYFQTVALCVAPRNRASLVGARFPADVIN